MTSRAADLWRVFDAPVEGRRVPGTLPVACLGLLVGATVSAYTVHNGSNLYYRDAMSHLTIARRLIDGQNPGFQQLGTVWLPFPHLLMVPFVASMLLFHTGIAGSIVGTGSLASACASTYRILARVGVDGIGRLAALAVLLLNPSYLYLCTTALTEPVLIATMLACIAGLVGWATAQRNLSGGELAVFAGVPAALAVLSRYEGWALTVTATVYVVVACRHRGFAWRRTLRMVASFLAAPLLAIGWWFTFNYISYGSALDFVNGPYSANAFNAGFRYQGLLETQGHLGLSVLAFFGGLVEIAGGPTLVVAAVGLLLMTAVWGLDLRALTIWLAGTSTAFLVYSLYEGQHLMINDFTIPTGDFNNRQAVSALPFVALACGVLLGLRREALQRSRAVVLGAALVGLVWQNLWWADDYRGRTPVIAEALIEHDLLQQSGATQAARWLGDHYDGGMLLVDDSKISEAPVMGLPMSDQYNRSSGSAYDAALRDPVGHVRWILMDLHQLGYNGSADSKDQVTAAMGRFAQFGAAYQLVYSKGDTGVYRRVSDPTGPESGDVEAGGGVP